MNRYVFPSFILTIFLIVPGSVFAATPSLPTVTLVAGRFKETIPSENLSSWVHLDTKKVRNYHYDSEIETPIFCPTQKDFCDFTTPLRNAGHTEVRLSRTINKEGVKQFVETLGVKVNLPAEDAIFAGDENNRVYVKSPEKPGQELDADAAVKAIIETLENESQNDITITLPVTTSEPKIKAGDKDKLGITELIGEGKSNFAGSPKNRVYNIKRALQDFTGVVVLPGQEFSFVQYLGEVDGEHGYLPELVIRNNKTEPEFGGGICQVSSTIFRAAIYSGLKITERRNHSYAVQYYKPYGMDATIYVPRPDFKFVNTTSSAIVMQPEVEGYNLTFRFFGTRDGRVTTVDGPHILEKNDDGSIKKTVFTQVVKDKDGKEMERQVFTSNYKSPKEFPHPDEESQNLTEKPKNWSIKQWRDYQRTR